MTQKTVYQIEEAGLYPIPRPSGRSPGEKAAVIKKRQPYTKGDDARKHYVTARVTDVQLAKLECLAEAYNRSRGDMFLHSKASVMCVLIDDAEWPR